MNNLRVLLAAPFPEQGHPEAPDAADELASSRLRTADQRRTVKSGNPLGFDFGTYSANNGNLLSQTITANSSYSWTQYYAYDGVNRLAMASENAAITGSTCPGGATWCRQYGYDHFGNRWIAASLDTLHMATPTSQSTIDPATNRLASGTYDAAGNMTAYPFLTDGGSMSYDANNKTKAFTKTGASVDTKYDAPGRRVRKVHNSGTTVWVR